MNLFQVSQRKKYALQKKNNSGFIALFFVLFFAASMVALVFTLSSKSSHLLNLFSNMRDSHVAKMSAFYCLRTFMYNKSINQGYKPVMNQPVYITDDSYCVFESFSEVYRSAVSIADKGTFKDGTIVGMSTMSPNIVSTCVLQVRGVKMLKNNNQQNIVSRTLRREYYIRDSL